MIGDDALAARMSNIEGSGVRRMFDLIRTMKDPINLSIGQAHYDTPQEVKDAAIAAIQEGRNRYTVTEGNADLNDAISERLATRWGGRPEAVMVTSGVSGGLLLSHFATIDPGDEVLLPDPYFVMYRNVLELVGGKAKYYDLYPKGRSARLAPRPRATRVADRSAHQGDPDQQPRQPDRWRLRCGRAARHRRDRVAARAVGPRRRDLFALLLRRADGVDGEALRRLRARDRPRRLL